MSTDIKATLQKAKQQLENISESPALDAELLLAHCLKKERSYLYTWSENHLTDAQQRCFEALLKKRLDDYPVAYLIGTQPFWTLDLIVTPDVLIPRPETELLVETALDKIKNIDQPKILDLGTGTGAIALAIAAERADAKVIASDASADALAVAQKNALKHGLSGQLQFIQSNWFSKIKEKNFDLIVSNPPYIAPNDPHLEQTIRHEPQQALVAENQGMSDLETIIKNSPAYLTHEGWLMVEHGFDQGEQTLQLFVNNHFTNCKISNDLFHNPRITLGKIN